MKKVKIYKTFHAYKSYLDDFYIRFPHLRVSDFDHQREALIHDGAPWIFSWSTNNDSPHIKLLETVHNNEYLQKAWTKNFKNDKDWQIKIVLEQIKEFQPDVCVLYPPELFTDEILSQIRSILKHPVIIAGYDGMNRENNKLYNSYDLIFTCSEYISSYYKKFNKTTYTLPFGFDQSILKRIKKSSRYKYKVGFTGSIFPDVHDNRYEFLRRLSSKYKIEIRSDFGKNMKLNLFSKNQLKRLIKEHDVQNYFGLWRVDKNNEGAIYGLEMYQFIRDSGISINMHGDKISFAANVRMYEITGVGSCLLTDWKENMDQMFILDKEVVTFKSADEAKDKIKFLLKNENVRSRIAQAGQKRTLQDYTYNNYMPKLFNYISNL